MLILELWTLRHGLFLPSPSPLLFPLSLGSLFTSLAPLFYVVPVFLHFLLEVSLFVISCVLGNPPAWLNLKANRLIGPGILAGIEIY